MTGIDRAALEQWVSDRIRRDHTPGAVRVWERLLREVQTGRFDQPVGSVVLTSEEAATAARAVTRYAHEEVFEEDAQRLYDLADRMGGAR